MQESNRPVQNPPIRHRWPWFVAAAVIVGIILAALAIRAEANRVREQRQFSMPEK